MLLRILELAASADLIGPLVGLAKGILYGPSHTFLVPGDCGWSGWQIELLLKQHGVKLWGRLIIHRTIIFTVRLAQAEWTQELLRREGIPVLSRPVRAGASRSSAKHRRGPVESLLGWLDACLERLAHALAGFLAG